MSDWHWIVLMSVGSTAFLAGYIIGILDAQAAERRKRRNG